MGQLLVARDGRNLRFDSGAARQIINAMDSYEDSPDHAGALLNLANHNALEDYWKHGEGAAKIRWGTPGDYTRCVRLVGRHVTDEAAHRICAQWHHDVTHMWPGDHRNK